MKLLKDTISKRLVNQIARYRTQVEKFNADLEAYKEKTGDYELPLIDCSIIGYEELLPAQIFDFNEVDAYGFRCELDGSCYYVSILTDEDGEVFVDGWDNGYDSLLDTLKYQKRRIRKGLKVFASADPDRELEKDDDD